MLGPDQAVLEAQRVAPELDQPQPGQQPRHIDRVEMLAAGNEASGRMDGEPISVELDDPLIAGRQADFGGQRAGADHAHRVTMRRAD